MKKKYYKFISVSVTKQNGEMSSYFMTKQRNKGLCRTYVKDMWTYPQKLALKRGYGLTCFDSIGNAIDFSRGVSYGEELWECEIGIVMTLPWKSPTEYKNYLNGRTVGTYIVRSEFEYGWPDGTIMTDKIKLIKRVDKLG